MRAVLDACVLYPTLPREIVLGCARVGLIVPVWSARILEEWRRAVLRRHPEQSDGVTAEIAALRAAFPGAEVALPPGLEESLSLPDANDRHVLAAAIAARTDALVTFNMADFPGRTLARHGIRPRHPDGLFCEFLDDAPQDVVRAVADAMAPLGGLDPRAALKRAKLPRLGKTLRDVAPPSS